MEGRGEQNNNKKKKSVVFPCKAQSMAEACVNGKSHFRLEFSECFCSFPSMCARSALTIMAKCFHGVPFLSFPLAAWTNFRSGALFWESLRSGLISTGLFLWVRLSSCSSLHRYIFLLPGMSSLTSSPLVFCCYRVIVFMQLVWSKYACVRGCTCVCVWGGLCGGGNGGVQLTPPHPQQHYSQRLWQQESPWRQRSCIDVGQSALKKK